MSSIFGKLLGRSGNNPPSAVANEQPLGVASAHESGEDVQREYEEFCQTFYFLLGERLIDFLVTNKVDRLSAWFHPSTPEPEPKCFIRFANDATRKGVQVWQQPGLSLYLEGRWDQGGGPSQYSRDCLSVLAQILGMPIKVFYRPTEDAELMVLRFEP